MRTYLAICFLSSHSMPHRSFIDSGRTHHRRRTARIFQEICSTSRTSQRLPPSSWLTYDDTIGCPSRRLGRTREQRGYRGADRFARSILVTCTWTEVCSRSFSSWLFIHNLLPISANDIHKMPTFAPSGRSTTYYFPLCRFYHSL